MKRSILLCLGLAAFLGSNLSAKAQSAADTAAAIAERQDAEERYKRLNSAVDDLMAAQVAQQKRLAELTTELQRLREKVDRASEQSVKYASSDDLRSLAVRLQGKLQEIDRKRESDKKLILEELQRLAKLPPVAHEPRSAPIVSEPKSGGKEYRYKVKTGDTLEKIVEAYRAQGVKVTLDQVRKANPKVKGDRIIVGTTLIIPDSSAP